MKLFSLLLILIALVFAGCLDGEGDRYPTAMEYKGKSLVCYGVFEYGEIQPHSYTCYDTIKIPKR